MRNFCILLSSAKKLRRLKRQINRHTQQLNREGAAMKLQQSNVRQSRTRTLIQAGGILQKAGLLEQFGIQGGDDLQDYGHIHKAYALLGYLIDYDEKTQGF